jgi:flagellar protein FlbD
VTARRLPGTPRNQNCEDRVIPLTRLGGDPVTVNADLILSIEQTPDTVLSLVNGDKLLVREAPDVVIARVIDYRRRCAGTASRFEAVRPEAPDARP